MYFYKGQKILEANYGDLNSSKKQTKSEKEFDLRTLGHLKKIVRILEEMRAS